MKKTFALFAVSAMLLAGCAGSSSLPLKDGLTVYASFYPIYDFAKRVGKGHVTVVNLTPAGAEPHDYEPTTEKIAGLEEADAIFVNGLGMESWTGSLSEKAKSKTVTVTSGIPTRKIDGVVDPHVWLDPNNAIKEMQSIEKTLAEADPAHEADYENNLADATLLFTALDEKIAAVSASFTQKHIVVSHAAFGYFCDRYGLEQIYVDGISPDDEPTARGIAEVIDAVNEYGVDTVYNEELTSNEIAEKIADETGCAMKTLYTLEGLEEDELGTENYVSKLTRDVNILAEDCR
ncbi:MAG: metal ABC transporter substrate-binding protein [Bacilli bacterium]|jgi:zinc transport system substrate-binding protein|nr:metal ABC transporter substrate-binding protein [Bacilli bacterium]